MPILKERIMKMMSQLYDRCVGIVDSVSSYEVKGYLLDNAPTSVSLSSGTMMLFPRINGFLLIPNETGSLVGIVTWVGYNHISTGNDVDLPKGSRMVSISVLGHLVETIEGMVFERGAFSLPTVGDQIVLPTLTELETIIKNDSDSCIEIGTSPLTGNQSVKVSVNELFGRHLAVLGNTGSGKSCTVAGLIRWSIESSKNKTGKSPNARFIVLDPNGEYQNTFNDLDINVIHCTVKEADDGTSQLRVPAWMWTSAEWASVFQASEKTQKPLLREALRTLRASRMVDGSAEETEKRAKQVLGYIRSFLSVSIFQQSYLSNDKTKFGKEFRARIDSLQRTVNAMQDSVEWKDRLKQFCESASTELDNKHGVYNGNEYYNIFDENTITQLFDDAKKILADVGVVDDVSSVSEDDPIEFEISELAPYIEDLAADSAAAQYVDFMTMRIKSMLKNSVLLPVIGNTPEITLLNWIAQFLGGENDDKGKICVIDLSLLPSEMVHLLVATIARLCFESLQRYRKYYGKELPTLLVMEEAHSFIHRYSDTDTDSADKLCTRVFEKIAREGRKYGMGLLVSSQRPAELSPTVLSQCNSFILHRIVNDRDQEMVRKMVPDNMGNLLNELSQLPTKKAIVLGSVVTVPTIVDITELPQAKRPKSDTPSFWDVWTGAEERNLYWKPIVNNWQKVED